MRRRDVLGLLGGATVSWPLVARAQQEPKVAHIGFLGLGPASSFASWIDALWAGLHQLIERASPMGTKNYYTIGTL